MLMKMSKLLVLSALFAMSVSSAKAGVPDGIWSIPEPQGLEFTTFTDDGTRYYLYNPAAKMFFASGNSWGTQASARTFGYPFWVQPSEEADAPEGSYELWDDFYNPTDRDDVTGPHNCFTDDDGSTWVDHGSQGNYSWTFELVGDCVRFQNVALIADKPEYEGKYIGWDGTYIETNFSSVLRMFAPDEEGKYVDWKAVTEESYLNFVESGAQEAYAAGVAAYFTSFGLKKALEAAEEINLDATAALAVYTNTASTADELKAATELLNARIDLKKLIDECESKGFTETAAAKAVLADPAATVEDVKQAQKELDAAFVEWGKTLASVDNPVNMTSMIVNPNFDGASAAGWTSEGTAIGWGSTGQDKAEVAEHWSATFNDYQDIEGLPDGLYALGAKTSWRGDWNCMLKNVTGSYVYAKVGDKETKVPFNNTWSCLNTTSMAGSTSFGGSANETTHKENEGTENEVIYYAPNDPSCFRVYAEHGFYDTRLFFAVTGGKARIGIALPERVNSDDWSCFDSFTLTFYGNGNDVWQFYLNENMKNFLEVILDEEGLMDGQLVTKSYVDIYNAARVSSTTVTSQEEADAFLASVKATYDDLQKNIDLWKAYKTACTRAESIVVDFGGNEAAEILNDYLTMDMNEEGEEGFGRKSILEKHELTNEQLQSEIDWIESMIIEAQNSMEPGTDVTGLLVNPGFETGLASNEAEGWTVYRGDTNGNVTPGPLGKDLEDKMMEGQGFVNHIFEAWHCHDFDVHQEVKGLPAGVYTIEVQGYVRCEEIGYQRPNPIDETRVPISIYLNNSQSKFPNVYSIPGKPEGTYTIVEDWTVETFQDEDGNTVEYPNSTGGAAQAFNWGEYKVNAFGLIREGDVARIGVKGKMDGDWWAIWDNFKLTYQGFLPEYVKPALEEALVSIDTSKLMGKNVRDEAQKLVNDAQALLAGKPADMTEDEWGRAMYKLLDKVYDIVDDVNASVTLFEKLQAALEKLGNAKGDNSPASDVVKAEADALYNAVETGIANQTLTDEEATNYLAQIDDILSRLRLPDTTGASDDNVIDMTCVLYSPSFEIVDEWEMKTSTSEGWTNPENLGNDETQREACAMERWHGAMDMYQDLKHLPAGTYMLQVDAFCEISTTSTTQERAAESYAAWLADPNDSYYFLYAVDGENVTYAAPIANLAKGAPVEYPDFEDDVALAETEEVYLGEEETAYYWPTSLRSGRAFLDLGKEYDGIDGVFTNKIIVKVKEDGKLRIGLKRTNTEAAHWAVWDDFRLFYYGENSSKEVSGNALTVENITMGQPVKVEFFTLDGRKTNGMQKGIMIQKLTLDNGAVVVRKVRK